MNSQTEREWLLPDNVVPDHYQLILEFDPSSVRFDGTVNITLRLQQPEAQSITCHCYDLSLDSVSLHATTPSSNACSPETISYDRVHQTVTFAFPRPLQSCTPGSTSARLCVQFHGELREGMTGFYRGSYAIRPGPGSPRDVYAVAMLCPCCARTVFPCWDAPCYRASFDLSLIVPGRFPTVLANMPALRSSAPDARGWIRHDFAPTPPMATYLLVWFVGMFECFEATADSTIDLDTNTGTGTGTGTGTDANNEGHTVIPIRVWCRPTPRHSAVSETRATLEGAFAADVAQRALAFLGGKLGVPYTLPKLDLLAVPCFAMGAMETWGLALFSEGRLLLDNGEAPFGTRQQVARCVCHELTHMWFGNLVGLSHWRHLWLNEGFARWIEFDIVHSLFPHWGVLQTYTSSVLELARAADSVHTARCVTAEATGDPERIGAQFDTITYAKGSALVQHLRMAIGEETFWHALRLYVRRMSYRTVSPVDLWACVAEASGVEPAQVAAEMAPWLERPGFPLVTVVERSNKLRGARRFALLQQRCVPAAAPPPWLHNPGQVPGQNTQNPDSTLAGAGLPVSMDGPVWHVPLAIRYARNPSEDDPPGPSAASDPPAACEDYETSICPFRVRAISLELPEGPVLFNTLCSSLVRVRLSKSLWDEQLASIRDALRLAPSVMRYNPDVIGVLQDTVELARAQLVPTERVLQLHALIAELLDAGDSDLYTAYSLLYCAAFLVRALVRGFGERERAIGEEFSVWLVARCIAALDRVGWCYDATHDTENPGAASLRDLAFGYLVGEAHAPALEFLRGLWANRDEVPVPVPLHVPCLTALVASLPGFRELAAHYSPDLPAQERRHVAWCLGCSRDGEALVEALRLAVSGGFSPQDTFQLLTSVGTNPCGRCLAWAFVQERSEALHELLGPLLFSSVLESITRFTMTDPIPEMLALAERVPSARPTLLQATECIHRDAAWAERDHALVADYAGHVNNAMDIHITGE